MSVKIGSARIDERGKATGGSAGDQTKNEVSTQAYYVHKKGWRVFRATNPDARDKIGKCMEMACANQHIGYDQNQRNALYNAAKPYGFDVSKVTTNVETDCSALVRVCCAYAGITLPDFNTSSEPSTLLKSGAFTELTGSKYTSQPDYLMRGDILVTKTKGHTVVILTNGSKAGANAPTPTYKLGDRILRQGDAGEDVKQLQQLLIQNGYNLKPDGADGDFGAITDAAVRDFQAKKGLEVDGEVGPKTIKALQEVQGNVKQVQIFGGSCYVRKEPNTDAQAIGIATNGTILEYMGETAENGWNKVKFEGQVGWCSGKYSRVI